MTRKHFRYDRKSIDCQTSIENKQRTISDTKKNKNFHQYEQKLPIETGKKGNPSTHMPFATPYTVGVPFRL